MLVSITPILIVSILLPIVSCHNQILCGGMYMKLQKFGAKSATADSCFGLIGPHQCSAALGGPATSTEDLRHQGALN